MISELALNPRKRYLSPELMTRFLWLYFHLREIELMFGDLAVLDGVRSAADHLAAAHGDKNPAFVSAAAARIADPEGRFWRWCVDNLDELAQRGMFLRDASATPGYVDLQVVPPPCGSRVFRG